MRIVIFANGIIEDPEAEIARWVEKEDIVVCSKWGVQPFAEMRAISAAYRRGPGLHKL